MKYFLSKPKKTVKSTNIRNREEFDDEVFETFSYADDEDVKDDDYKDDKYDSDEFSRNISDLNKKSIVVEQLYPCDRCKRKLKSKLSLKKHQEMHAKRDSEDPKFVCNVCDRGNKICTFNNTLTKIKKKLSSIFTGLHVKGSFTYT